FDVSLFTQIHKSFVVNKEEILRYDNHSKTIRVLVQNESGSIAEIDLPVSDNFKQQFRK
ncbi:MAG: LytTR family transcriptional regulator DNA-binding domain-containing protein, partial [Flavobacteriales bacterium]